METSQWEMWSASAIQLTYGLSYVQMIQFTYLSKPWCCMNQPVPVVIVSFLPLSTFCSFYYWKLIN